MNYDFDLLKKHKTSLEEGLYYDAIESLKEDLDPQDIELIDKKENLREKIKTLLSIILDPSEPAKQTKLIFKFKEFLRDNYEWHYECFQQQYDRSNSRNILNIGGVPVLPERNIKRTESLQEVRNGIETLIGSDARFLVLHGPIGCGKSSLATQALYESDILHYFKDGIFWVMVGSDGKDKIRSLQEDLNVRLSDRDLNLSSNSDVALVQLKQRYLETKKDSLIILDDVHSKEVVEYLDVGVKFLITTRDINVIKDKESISLNVKVPDHFKQEESLKMFALSLNVDVENLPKTRINKILKFCKGHPISVAIVSAELADHKEDLKEGSSERWNYYINTLKKNRKNLNEDSDKYMKSAINLAIQSLSPKLKRCFEHFAIFPEDVNLKPEVLATVWDREKTEAENIMAEFRKKSLVVRYWNEALSSYVYGVHDLFLDYLKSNDITSDDRIRSLHKNLLDKYLSPCNWDASKLPKDDNYIFYYLGYHLLLAGMESKFSEIFTNLEFLEAKLQAVEPFDLVLDLKRYKNYISNKRNQFDVAALKEFIEWYGPFVHKGIDIAQLALQEPRNTYIHMEGRKLAEKRMSLNKNLSYIDFPLQHVERREWLPRTINMRDKKVTALCFDSCSNIVIATKGGSLELWNTKCIRLRMFTGHTDDINHLTISSYQLFSCSNDGTVREWKLDQDNNSEEKFDLSPERTQASYHDFWSSAKTGIEACNVLRLPGPVFWVAVYENFLCSICHNEMPELTIFKNNIEVRRLKIPGLKVCDFSRDGLFIMTGGSEGVHVVDLETFSVRQPISRPVIGISTLLNGSAGGLVTISKDRVDFWGDQTVKMTEGHHFTKPIEEKGANYTCYNTGCQIALVTEKNDILILDSDTGRTLQYISGEHVEKITAIAIKKGMIIVAYSNNKIEIKPINIVDVPISRIFWPLSHAMPVVAKVDKVENKTKLRIVKGHETTELFTSEDAVNNLSMVYTDLCQIVYATNWGDVFIVEGRMGKRRELNSFEFNCPTTVLEMFEFHGHRYVAASTSQDPVKILDTLTNNIRLFDASTKGAHSCNISQNGQVVISTLKSVQVWDFKNVEILTEYKGVRLLAINERVMILSDDSQITVIDINSGETIWTRKEEKCRLVSLSPDGDKLAFISGRKVHVKYLNLIQKTEKMNMYELPRLTSCHSYNSVAVSDGGVVCISTDEPCVFLVSPHHQLVTAAVQISSLVSSSDSFAAIDKLGALHILKPIDYHAINLNRLEISDD